MSMTDRELLELAAIAAGEDVEWLKTEKAFFRRSCSWPQEKGWFNPLHNDGEALRLAIKLGICIQFIPECDTVQVYQERSTTGEPFNIHVSALGDIETRRVIVQAAAEIGKAMQEVKV